MDPRPFEQLTEAERKEMVFTVGQTIEDIFVSRGVERPPFIFAIFPASGTDQITNLNQDDALAAVVSLAGLMATRPEASIETRLSRYGPANWRKGG